MKIEIQCSCGKEFEFDLESVDSRAPASLGCPDCGTSWTEYANAYLAQALDRPPPDPTPNATLTEAAQDAPSPSVEPSALVLRPVPVRVPVPGSPVTLSPMPGVTPPPAQKASFARGVLGAALGAALGGALWFLECRATGMSTILLGLGVGLLCGLGAYWLSRNEGSKELGAIAGVLTVLAILLTQYAVAQSQATSAIERAAKDRYEEFVAEAQQLLKSVPTGSDEEIQQFLTSRGRSSLGVARRTKVQPEELAAFRKHLSVIQRLANRQLTPAELAQFLRSDLAEIVSQFASSTTLFQSIGLLGAAIIIASAVLAYRINANA
jgi:hypothetical protein